MSKSKPRRKQKEETGIVRRLFRLLIRCNLDGLDANVDLLSVAMTLSAARANPVDSLRYE